MMPTPEELAADAEAFAPAGAPVTLGLIVLVERLVELKAQLDATEAHRKEVQKDYDDLRKRLLPRVLGDHGWTSARTPLGTLSLRTKTHVSVPVDRRGEFRAWCRDNDLLDLVTFDPSTLQGYVDQSIERGRPLPDFIRTFSETTVVLTRKKE